jgi:hypothetical protein
MIEFFCKELGVNLMIGSSDGRRISHKLNIELYAVLSLYMTE